MKNQYSGARLVLGSGAPVTDFHMPGSNQQAISASGEFNAHDKNEVLRIIAGMMSASSNGGIVPVEQSKMSKSAEAQKDLENRKSALAAAYSDPSGSAWTSLGSSLALQVSEQRDRIGFMRRVCKGQTLSQGQQARVNMPTNNIVAFVATSEANIGHQIIRKRSFYPDEFAIIANVRAELLEIEQNTGDLLEEMYQQALEAIMVKEDRLWKQMADKTTGVYNPLMYIAGNLTPGMLGQLRQAVTQWNLPATTALIANDFWTDIMADSNFGTFLDPVTKYDLVLNGQVATLAGMTMLTDAFRNENQKVLNPGEIYVVSSEDYHGAFSDRGGIKSTPTDGSNEGNTTRGWLMSEHISLALVNPKSVAKGQRR